MLNIFRVAAILSLAPMLSSLAQDAIDLNSGAVVVSQENVIHAKAAEMLRDEVSKRTGLRLPGAEAMPPSDVPAIVLGSENNPPSGQLLPPRGVSIPEKAEGYAIWVDRESRNAPTVFLIGRDDRGTLFAVGKLLRMLQMRKQQVILPDFAPITSAPRYARRGHEMGYRHWSNTYDAWDVDQYEQYIRDLVVFGVNTIMLTPRPRPYQESPHMAFTTWEMTAKLTALIDSYGLDSWLYIPLLEDISNPEEEAESLAQRRTLFEQCPAISAVFVPGGDPGKTPPELLLPWIEKLAKILRDRHPNAQVWLSNEDMSHEWNNTLLGYLERERPDWLSGVIYGTWTKLTMEDERARTPKRYPLVQYPDITHAIEAQYSVPGWDRAFAYTLGREPINPRPAAYAHIFRKYAPLTEGIVGYSDGVNDDVNKVVTAALAWDPERDLRTILTDYGRYYVGEDYGEAIADGLLALEANWAGSLIENETVEATLRHWQDLDKKISPENWRFQMGLFRAHYDAYVQRKLMRETALEEQVLAELRRASEGSVAAAVKNAHALLDADATETELKRRILELGDQLFKTIGMQLSVERHQANYWERGAVMDFLDRSLNNRLWLEAQFAEILAMPDEQARRLRVQQVLDWENPGPGGFYDDLGNPRKQPHLVQYRNWEDDPSYFDSVQSEYIEIEGREAWRLSWLDQAQTLYGEPLRMRYENLDPSAHYRLRVVYAGRFRPTLRLVADEQYVIHGPMPQPGKVEAIDALKLEYTSTNLSAPPQPIPVEFDIPQAATADGLLKLEWQLLAGRGIQVAEVWLLPKVR
jgi:hypothetical protein